MITSKHCSKCREEKLSDCFYRNDKIKSGLSSWCKDCTRTASRERQRANPQQYDPEYRRLYHQRNKDKINAERRERYWADPEKYRAMGRDYARSLLLTKEWTMEEAVKAMLARAKQRARKKGIAFDLDYDFLLSIAVLNCPVDGLPLDWLRELDRNGKPHAQSPSLDRIDSTKGYTKDNVTIISHKWNNWKSNMTVDDIELLYGYVESNWKEDVCGYEK